MRTVSHGDRQNRGRLRTKRTVKRVTFATIINVCVLQIETGLRCLMFASRSTVVLHSQVSPCTESKSLHGASLRCSKFAIRGLSQNSQTFLRRTSYPDPFYSSLFDLRGLSSHGSSKSTIMYSW